MTMEEVTRLTIDLIRPDIQRVLRDPVALCCALREFKVIDESLLTTVVQMVAHFNIDSIWDLIFKELPKRCTVYELEDSLAMAGYKDIAERLQRLSSTFLGQRGINSAVPCSEPKREGLQLFFKRLKREIYNGTDYNFLKDMSNHMERVLFSNNPQKGKITPDKYVITLAVMLDSPIEENELFIHGLTEGERFMRQDIITKLQKIVSKTPNQYISSMFLFPRMAVENALKRDFQEGEESVDLALQHASFVCNCVEKADMYYRIVHFYHRMFEFTQSENALQRLLKYGACGIRCLERETEEVGNQWKRLFLLRMILCLLGMSTECRVIQDRIYCSQNVAHASKYLAKVDEAWEGIERKAMLLYFMAKARLYDVQDQLEVALHYAKDLKRIAEENKSKHLVFVEQYVRQLEFRRSSQFQVLQPTGQYGIDHLLIMEDTRTGSNKSMRRIAGDGSCEENNHGVCEEVENSSDIAQFSSLSGPEALVWVEMSGNTSVDEETALKSLDQEGDSLACQLHQLKIVIHGDDNCFANSEIRPSHIDQADWQNLNSSSFDLNLVMNKDISDSTILQSPLRGELSDSDTNQSFLELREEPEGASLP
ncbi:hypothetical protein CHS0354_009354 [Potamilus streckersoni]|uniref:Uncharacterized protein n=1 Tax=Potamilus streckersoni TaxID=2493646 RepID=A0AAE0WDE2_9BIVA|nr:hypothetical protein CHS0354_009354 [Potamilus streckersoni]